jgi:two-component system response regulator NreC
VVDDHPVLRAGLRKLLEGDDRLSVVGEAATVGDALLEARAARPDVVLLDIRDAFAAGASGYVVKDAAEGDLIGAILEIAAGGRYVHPSLGAQLVAAEHAEAARTHTDPLSPREREVLHLLALGHTNQEIGRALEISVRTVETHRTRMMRKLGAENRADLVGYARAEGLI